MATKVAQRCDDSLQPTGNRNSGPASKYEIGDLEWLTLCGSTQLQREKAERHRRLRFLKFGISVAQPPRPSSTESITAAVLGRKIAIGPCGVVWVALRGKLYLSLGLDGNSDFSYSRLNANTITSLQQIRHRLLQRPLHQIEHPRTSRPLSNCNITERHLSDDSTGVVRKRSCSISRAHGSPRDKHTRFATSGPNYSL